MAERLGTVDPKSFPDETFDYYSIPAYDTGRFETTRGYDIGSAKQLVQSNDVLLSRIVPHIRRAWVVGERNGRRMIGSGEWIVFRDDRVHPPYLRQLLTSDWFHPEFMRTVSGVGGSLLRARPSTVALIKIPLPSLPEQRRIAAILDQAEALRAKRRQALAKLNTLTQSVFLEMFGDLIENTKRWPSISVGDYVDGFETGKSLSAPDEGPSSKFRILKISAVTSLDFNPDETKPLPPDFVPSGKDIVRSGDLLFSRANTSDLVGATAYVFSNPSNLVLPDKLWRFAWRAERRVEPLFIWHLFRQQSFRREIGRRATGTSGSMKNISQEKVLTIRTGLPPLELQQKFESAVRSIEKHRTQMIAGQGKMDALFASLQHRAFRGEL